MSQIEILAPVGSREMLTAAAAAGADAVYLGYAGFNARSGADNFGGQTLAELVGWCHARALRVHVAMNTLVWGPELPELQKAVCAVAESGADAVICQDLAVAALFKTIAPAVPLHGSTQMSVHTLAGARQLAEMGFRRVILARELSLPEIARITEGCGIETEVFVHGALCMSVSGQCYLSAFLGGRSGNRGRCAGPCRLPFDANALPEGVPGQACHLSLKDNSALEHLPALAAMGVASVKIEGRLRTPEYVAAAVDACLAARAGRAYDRELLQGAFSRSGFTDGYLAGKIDGGMFGVRRAEDAEATRKALPALRALYRRERQRVPVTLSLHAEAEGMKLTVRDKDGNWAVSYSAEPLSPARNDPAPALQRSLEKCGGTPFFAEKVEIDMDGGPWYAPGSAVNELRRAALEALLQKRERPRPWPITAPEAVRVMSRSTRGPKHRAGRFASWAQVPPGAEKQLDRLVLPIGEAERVPAVLRSKTVLELPRAMFGALEEDTARRIAGLRGQGFAGFEANNLAHFALLKGVSEPVYGGFGLNLANPLAAGQYAAMGLAGAVLSPELRAADMACIGPAAENGGLETGAIAYGHMPLMLTRACPLHNLHGCAGCPKQGTLTDRKAKKLPVRCGLGVRTVYNALPLYMGDRPDELPVDWDYLYFTIEDAARAAEVLKLFCAAKPFDGEFTRGLYRKGTAD